MYKYSVLLCRSFNSKLATGFLTKQNVRLLSNVNESEKTWDLYTAICVERHPVITAPLKEIEAKVQNLLRQIEFENSMKCDHELQLESDNTQKKDDNSENSEGLVVKLAQDLEDEWNEEFKNFKFAPREPDASVTDPLKRRLEKHLVLLTNQKIGEKFAWIPPQGIRNDGESLRQTAERILETTCGTDFRVQFYGNAPIGFYKYTYPKSVREKGSYGAKIFYYLVKYKSGSVQSTTKHQWCDREELRNTLSPALHKSVSQFLIPE